jgi:Rrf2 family transcriptional regulator, nitric oxide-sensitive transcriptional repressor
VFRQPAGACAITPVCRLRGVFQEASEALYGVLDRYTLADLVVERTLLAQVLQIAPRTVVRKVRA